MSTKGHRISSVEPDSIAEALEIEAGDYLTAINGCAAADVFDYHYLLHDEKIVLKIIKADGEEWEFEIEKDYEEDLGIQFDEGLMDEYRSCRNHCIFCFIDQMPPGMRETLYFKDDDARLSFLQGNYITLTNMSEEDLERIIKYKLSPVNLSVHTTNPKLRCKMLNNRFAGEVLDKIRLLYDAQMEMNSQVVLCRGYNDGEELERTIKELSAFYPYMKSLSVVPVGLTKYREHLTVLEKFSKEAASEVLDTINRWQKKLLEEKGSRFVYASDEWYLTAERPLPSPEDYEGFGQLENGVGMISSLTEEFDTAFDSLVSMELSKTGCSLATGVLAAPLMRELSGRLMQKYPSLQVNVYPVRNDFFGEDITVAGLVTGADLISQLTGRKLGERLLIPEVMLRAGEKEEETKHRVFLDDVSVHDVEKALQIPVCIVQSDGKSLIEAILGREQVTK